MRQMQALGIAMQEIHGWVLENMPASIADSIHSIQKLCLGQKVEFYCPRTYIGWAPHCYLVYPTAIKGLCLGSITAWWSHQSKTSGPANRIQPTKLIDPVVWSSHCHWQQLWSSHTESWLVYVWQKLDDHLGVTTPHKSLFLYTFCFHLGDNPWRNAPDTFTSCGQEALEQEPCYIRPIMSV